jgi:hypothetical protein
MPFDLQPTLRGAMVTLRPLRADDFVVLYGVASGHLSKRHHLKPSKWQHVVNGTSMPYID